MCTTSPALRPASPTPRDTLILYTDGLIERREEDIDASLARLTTTLAQVGNYTPEQLADTLLSRLDVADGAPDDIALIVIRL